MIADLNQIADLKLSILAPVKFRSLAQIAKKVF